MHRVAGVVLLLVLGGCAGLPGSAGADFIVVRHAEKADDGSRDPPLSARGVARVQALVRQLAQAPLVAAYATPFRRTQQTAQAVGAAHGLAVTTYDPGQPAGVFAAVLRARHPRGTVLVVGHSNTTPAIAAALCGCTVAPMAEDDYGTIYRIHVDRTGRRVLDGQSR